MSNWNASSSGPQDEEDETTAWLAVCAASTAMVVYYYETYVYKTPCHNSIRTGSILIHEILHGNETRCYQDFRMYKSTFIHLCNDLVNRYDLECTRGMSAYEEVGMFLMTCAHGVGNRLIQEMFNHSGETIHRHFHVVLCAINKLAADIIKPDANYRNGGGYHEPQNALYLPYFKDCIGAIDGTHVKASVPEENRIPYIGRKGYPTQNILAICDFNMCFTFAWAGWEGAAHDSRIFGEALRSQDIGFPHPPEYKYYLVDSGYPHMFGYMGPYKGSNVRYHLEDFRRTSGNQRARRNAKEKFNYLHSSCRMIIERTFGVWRVRFAILANMPSYSITTQRDIVIATMAIHNYIRKKDARDDAFLVAEQETYVPPTSTSDTNNDAHSNFAGEDNNYWFAIRDSIANSIRSR